MAKICCEIENEILENEDVDIKLTHFALEHCAPNKKEEFGLKSDYSLHFVLYGKGIFKSANDEKSVILGGGSVFLLYPHEEYNYRPVREDPWSYMWFAFTGKNADKMMARCGLAKDAPFRTVDDFRQIRELLSEFREQYDKTRLEKLTQTSYFLRLISALIATNKKKETLTSGDVSMRSKRLKEILLYLMANYSMDISPETIAQSLNISVGYMNSIVSNSIGLSVTTCLNALRVSHACELISHSTLSIEEISKSVGFNDPKYFSRIFSRLKQMSPRDYRKCKIKEDPYEWLKERGVDYH